MCAFLNGCLISAPGSIPKLSPAYRTSAPRFPTEQNWQAAGSLDLERLHMPMRDGELYPFKWGRAARFCRSTYPRHTPINHKVGPVHKAALIACQEQNGLSLLDGFAEAA